MIVRRAGESVHLITQPDHARLARTLMERCVELTARPRRDSILRATGEHDAAWAAHDAAPTVNPTTGHVADFVTVALGVRQRVWPRTVAGLADDPWAAALVAHHAATVYGRFRPVAEWASFFPEMEAARDALVAGTGLTHDDLLADYPFLRLGDLLSLAFCTAATEEQRYERWTLRPDGNRVVVAPDLFGGTTVPLAIQARELPLRPFASDAELREALRAAPTITLRGEVVGSSS